MYLKSATFNDANRCFAKGDKFDFQNITLLVGDQGCGKSTLLELLGKNSKILTLELSEETIKKGTETFYFDTEKMNPRITDPNHYANMDGTNKGIGFGNALKSRFTSHGETLVGFTVDALKKAENCIVFLDEPESALSLRNQYNLTHEIFAAAANRNCQFVVATHCLILIQTIDSVLSLEHRKWMPSQEFIQTQQGPKNVEAKSENKSSETP